MSWEDMDKNVHPCYCGEGTITVFVQMDDWNRKRSREIINCPKCAKKKRDKEVKIKADQYRLQELDQEIKTYFAEHYMDEWLNYFTEAPNRKDVWSLAKKIGIEEHSLSSFYKRNKDLSMGAYIRDLARYDNMEKIVQVLNIKDHDFKCKVEEAMTLRKAEYARAVAEWHS